MRKRGGKKEKKKGQQDFKSFLFLFSFGGTQCPPLSIPSTELDTIVRDNERKTRTNGTQNLLLTVPLQHGVFLRRRRFHCRRECCCCCCCCLCRYCCRCCCCCRNGSTGVDRCIADASRRRVATASRVGRGRRSGTGHDGEQRRTMSMLTLTMMMTTPSN